MSLNEAKNKCFLGYWADFNWISELMTLKALRENCERSWSLGHKCILFQNMMITIYYEATGDYDKKFIVFGRKLLCV